MITKHPPIKFKEALEKKTKNAAAIDCSPLIGQSPDYSPLIGQYVDPLVQVAFNSINSCFSL